MTVQLGYLFFLFVLKTEESLKLIKISKLCEEKKQFFSLNNLVCGWTGVSYTDLLPELK